MTPTKQQIAAALTAYGKWLDTDGNHSDAWLIDHSLALNAETIRYCLTALSDDGWKLCPLEPTRDMVKSTDEAMTNVNSCIQMAHIHGHSPLKHKDELDSPIFYAYKAMLSAAPAYAPTEKQANKS